MDNDKVLSAIATANGILQLGITAGGIIIPLVAGVVKAVRREDPIGDGATVEYTIVLQTGKEQLAEAKAKFDENLDLVNAELARLGIAPQE